MTNGIINVAETFGLTDDMTMSGPSPLVRRRYSPPRRKAIKEAADLWARTFDGDLRAGVLVQEALSTSDLFVSVTGDVLDREMLQRYTDITPEWSSFASRTTVRNFKPKKLVDILGGRTALDVVPELTEYPTAESEAAEYEIAVRKFGRRFGFSWEAQINDDIDQLRQIPDRFASASAITETNAAIEQIADLSTGAPNAAFFKAGNNNAPVSAALTHDNLVTGIQAVNQREDSEGNLTPPENGLILVVGPGQELNAKKILSATEIRDTTGGQTIIRGNELAGSVELVVVKRLPGLAWFILPKPNGPRPAVAVAFLRGWETPDIRVKSNGGNRLGGGAVPPEDGDFDDDSVYYRVRHVTGGATVDPVHTYAGTGA